MKERRLMFVNVFIDLENADTSTERRETRPEKIRIFLSHLSDCLAKKGFQIESVLAVACSLRIKQIIREQINAVFVSQKAVMCWCEGRADEVLMAQFTSRLASRLRSNAVVLVTSDGDFAPLVRTLSENNTRYSLLDGK